MAEKRISVRLAAIGGREVRAELQGIGDAGEQGISENAAWYCWHASRRRAVLEACWERDPRWRRSDLCSREGGAARRRRRCDFGTGR